MDNGLSGTTVDREGNPLELVLYKFDTCPYCVRVFDKAEALGVPLKFRDTHQDRSAQEELVRLGGRSMVPCLFVNGKPMYESLDIMAYLENEVRVV